jgi:hypothetical protein
VVLSGSVMLALSTGLDAGFPALFGKPILVETASHENIAKHEPASD